jgi:UDP-N-acetylmuramoyl-L-alanine---L-glutamate ligase
MKELLTKRFDQKDVAILGFGREGKSTLSLIRSYFPDRKITVIDENPKIAGDPLLAGDPNIEILCGKGCFAEVIRFGLIIKSPGIPSNALPETLQTAAVTSQTDLFLQVFGKQVTGVTGTKGKSTTSSLICHIFRTAGRDTLLAGNIGIPPFDCIPQIRPETCIVMEFSSHQLEYISHSPHTAVLLNLFQEHLDHYHSYLDYQLAKLNIARYQTPDDHFIFNQDNETLRELIESVPALPGRQIPFSLAEDTLVPLRIADDHIQLASGNTNSVLYDTRPGQPLPGRHNLYNIMAAAAACSLNGVAAGDISRGIRSFKGLEHRIEPVGEFGGIHWYNDSIATIPEAAIEAVRTLKNVDTLILGGFDRGIDYHILYPFFPESGIRNLIFVGEAGKRMLQESRGSTPLSIRMVMANDYAEVVRIAAELTQPGKICLLSPAAASYDMFRNFEERGNEYKKNVRTLTASHPSE